MRSILHHYHDHEIEAHFGATRTVTKVLESGFYWPILFKDAYRYVLQCNRCQMTSNISMKHEMSLNNILV